MSVCCRCVVNPNKVDIWVETGTLSNLTADSPCLQFTRSDVTTLVLIDIPSSVLRRHLFDTPGTPSQPLERRTGRHHQARALSAARRELWRARRGAVRAYRFGREHDLLGGTGNTYRRDVQRHADLRVWSMRGPHAEIVESGRPRVRWALSLTPTWNPHLPNRHSKPPPCGPEPFCHNRRPSSHS